VLTLLGGAALGQLAVVAVSPWLARLYSPEAFGEFGLALAAVGFGAGALALRYDVAIVSAAKDEEAAHLTIFSLGIAVPVGAVAVGATGALIHTQALGFGDVRWRMLPLIFLGLIATSWFMTLRFALVRAGEYALVARATLGQGLGRAVGQVAGGYLGVGAMGLLGAEVLGRAFGLRAAMRTLGSRLSAAWSGLSPHHLRCTLGRYAEFPKFALPSSLLDLGATTVPVPLIAELYGLGAAGAFAMSQRLFMAPAALVAQQAADVLFADLSELARTRPDAVARATIAAAGRLAAVAALPVVLAWTWGGAAVSAVLGAGWDECAAMIPVLAPWVFFQGIMSPLSRVVFVIGGQRLKLAYDLASVTASTVPILLVSGEGGGAVAAVEALGWAHTAAYMVYAGVLALALRGHRRRHRV
jgi:O-antigen/teichoic acid export membrane protein